MKYFVSQFTTQLPHFFLSTFDTYPVPDYAHTNKFHHSTTVVRRRIKETTWEKQNQREGFRESFKRLISQFEKPEDDKTRNIYTQNQEMLRNQLALTEGVRANQRAITQGFNQLERLADIRELPSIEQEPTTSQSGTEQSRTTPTLYDIEKKI